MAYYYYQMEGGNETWKPIRDDKLYTIEGAMFRTILSVDSPVAEDLNREQLAAIKYKGPLYFDLDDAVSPASTAVYAKQLVNKLEELGVFGKQLDIYASGGKGFHILVPDECFMTKPPKGGMAFLPAIYKEMAFQLAVDSMDFRVYTARRGRMFRLPNVKRPNGLYKVKISYEELEILANITDKADAEAAYKELCSQPRSVLGVDSDSPELSTGLLALFDQAKAKVAKATTKTKKQREIKLPSEMPSFDALLRGEGVNPDAGFQNIAMQVAITAHARGMSCEDLLEASVGLCEKHKSDGNRYDTPSKRRSELIRMWEYTADNPCYTYSPAAITALLTHTAPDLHGLTVTQEEVAEAIAETELGTEVASEYDHAGLIMTRNGAFTLTENGPKMVTAVSFDNVTELVSSEDNKMSVLEADMYIAGRKVSSNMPIELESFNSVANVNKVLMRHGQVFSGNDVQARGMFLRMVEKARKSGKRMYVSSREGLDIVKIAGHENEEARKGFLVWSDNRGVSLPPHIAESGVQMRFVGYPDPHGQFQTDIEDAPKLVEWLKDSSNKKELQDFLYNLLTCQSPAHIGKLLGWMVATFWRMLFHDKFDKFPLLHINGAAGMGKCLGVDTPIRMFDGSIKKVQDVAVGDKLLGPDGKSRNVLSLARGKEKLYRVKQVGRDSYVVNKNHILSTVCKPRDTEVIINMAVLDFLRLGDLQDYYYGWAVPNVLQGDFTKRLTNIEVEALDIGDYYGFKIDGDKLFLLGDFTVTHNTETTKLFCNLHYYNTEPKMLTPTSTIFAVTSAISGSSSIPLVLDEFKPSEMNPTVYDRFKLILRDAYNCRTVERGGGTRESADYRSVHRTALSAPVIFIAEAAESESALMERVVLLTQVKPPSIQASANYARFSSAAAKRNLLGIIGKYIATSIVRRVNVDEFSKEFLPIYNDTRKELMNQEGDLGYPDLVQRSGTKERTVFNYAVCKFGLMKFSNLIAGIYGQEFDSLFSEMMSKVCSSVEDIQTHTTPEWLKVLNTFTDMTRIDPESACFLVPNKDYTFSSYNGKNCIEFNLRSCYHKYRQYMAIGRSKALFPGESSFVYAMSTITALVAKNVRGELDVPGGSFIFDLQELRSNGYIAP